MESSTFPNWLFARLTVVWLLPVVFATAAIAEPTVTNVRAAQRAATNLVDVYYDLAGAEADGATITVALSGDGGGSFGLPVSALTGDVGSGVQNALNRRIVWNASIDRPDFAATTMRLRITAASVPPEPPRSGFALIPAGSFQMGDSFGEAWSAERPVHTVYVSAFYMGRTEVTYGQWLEVLAWAAANGYTDLAGVGSGKAADHPVHSVAWLDVVKWCNAFSERDGLDPVYRASNGEVYRTGQVAPVIEYGNRGYRLPSEAEWEKAARGGLSGQRFPWGDTITHSQANYDSYDSYAHDLSATRGHHPSYTSGGTPFTSPVGSFRANGYGLYDMAGNLWEWCNDWYGNYASSPVSDPRGPSSGSDRMSRGGSWNNDARRCRVSVRNYSTPDYHLNLIGFRLARSP